MHNVPDEHGVPRAGRRRFLQQTGSALLAGLAVGGMVQPRGAAKAMPSGSSSSESPKNVRAIKLFLCGDVMTGRGIDQILTRPGDPRLHEAYAASALDYVSLAEQASGRIPRHVPPGYVWGDALAELERAQPDARIVNLETAVTVSGDAWPGKGINYRMHPANVACLTAARIDCCVLANNHVLDWGYEGLQETITTLRTAGLRIAGAGPDLAAASAPAEIELPGGGRVVVFAYGSASAGVPKAWGAGRRRAGVNLIDESERGNAERVARDVRSIKRPGDLAVVSLHWGTNWGYGVPREQREFARALIDEAGADVVYGHSSHHPRPIEVHHDKLILYGCGDFLNDYEGIGGYEAYRPELAFMYLPELDAATGRLQRLTLIPTRIRGFRVNLASAEEADWLKEMLQRVDSATPQNDPRLQFGR